MKTAKTIVELATEVEHLASLRKDIVADTRAVEMQTNGDSLEIGGVDSASEINNHAHSQIASRLKIPKRYYDRLRIDHPDLLADNVNHLFRTEPERRMVRLYDGPRPTVRAFLSDRYRRIDNYELLRHGILPTITQNLREEVEIASCEVTESRMYLKVMSRKVEGEIRKGDPVRAGFTISNSETGVGAFDVRLFLVRLVCTNGMMGESMLRQHHLGKRIGEVDSVLFTDSTIRKDDEAFMAKVQDVVSSAVSEAQFEKALELFRQSQGRQVQEPHKSIEVLSQKFSLSEGEQSSLTQAFFTDISRDGCTHFGLVNALTNTAEHVDNYDRATELEQIGYDFLKMPARELKPILTAA